MSFKKQLLKTKPVCKVTFALTAEEVENASTVYIVGEFNDWSETANPLKKFKNGNFKTNLDLVKGEKYQFKYLVDGSKWINDSDADMYLPNNFSGENSVIIAE
ncbi:MAG: isoamylase early set domain-containing protein [Flavobacteriales bacterium]|nr:isoamylase early set domain-containing protein [Flavobacteriales bacterium]